LDTVWNGAKGNVSFLHVQLPRLTWFIVILHCVYRTKKLLRRISSFHKYLTFKLVCEQSVRLEFQFLSFKTKEYSNVILKWQLFETP
jgi:hypothetical protein